VRHLLRCIFFVGGVSFALLQGTSVLAAEPSSFQTGLSLQGFTGLLNTPSAHVQDEGSMWAQYGNQIDPRWRTTTSFQDNYIISVGLFNFAEFGGRLTNTNFPAGVRDLSANVKLSTAGLTRDKPYFPVIGAGIQDASGGATLLRTSYLVLSEDFWRFRFSAGYGRGPDRMKGAFGGAELQAHEWVYLLGEYDTKETNVGIRIVTPEIGITPIKVSATAKTSIDYRPGNFDIAVGITFPLDFRKQKQTTATGSSVTVQRPSVELQAPNSEPKTPNSESKIQHSESTIQNPEPRTQKLTDLHDRLVKAGFQNVRVGDNNGALVVIEYENVTFNHNEMDALGVITGMAVQTLPDSYKVVRLIIKKKNIRMMQVTMPLAVVAAYLESGRDSAALKEKLVVQNSSADDDGLTYANGDTNSSFLTTSLMLWPGLDTKVGTEMGVFDYALSVKPELYVNLWKGFQVNARWDLPVARSANMDGRNPSYYNPTPARMERLMLFQGINLLPGVMANIGGGQILPDINGTLNELSWQPGDGSHLVTLEQSWGRNSKTDFTQTSYLASYRYYYTPLDLSLGGTAGRFWAQDKGFQLELKRFFGDTAVSIYYKNTRIQESMSQGLPLKWQAAGIQFAFPLTPEKDMKHYYKMQLRGADQWGYAQETTVARSNSAGANYLPPVPLALNPLPSTALLRSYYNRDRLSGEYIASHLDRLRAAWIRYRDSF